jgi:ureidoacrylate peracid hydrolase
MSLELLDPRRTAFLVIDMQNAFCHPEGTLGISGVDVTPAEGAIARTRTLVNSCRAVGVPVVWTLQEHFAVDESRGRKRLAPHTAARKRVSALAGTWDAEIVEELHALAAAQPSLVVRKHRFGGFYETRLDLVLRMLGVDALLIAGVTANACVETTIREAYLRDYDVVAVTDCIAAVRPEWEPLAHAVWKQYFGALANADEVARWLERGAPPRVRGLGHVLLETRNLEESEAFYIDVLGFTVRKRDRFRDGRPLTVTNEGLGLTDGRDTDNTSVEHIAFHADGIRALGERIHEAGGTVLSGPEPSAYGVSLYVADPDGNQIELYGDEGDAGA